MNLGYLGPRGTFSEEAALDYAAECGAGSAESGAGPVPGGAVELVPYKTIAELISAVDGGKLDRAIVPAENSTEGSVNTTWDMLLHEASVMIVGEMVRIVSHHLLAQRGIKVSDVGTILSHPHALAQCRGYLATKFPRAKTFETTSTAEAARVVSVNDLPLAAIGTRRCAELYGLDILEENVQDVKDNVTRFLLLSKSSKAGCPRTGCDKTSIVCSTERDRPGSLYGLLEVFARRNINLTRIESRPSRKFLGDYVFFIDLDGHIEDSGVSEALQDLEGRTFFTKVLGSYPKACLNPC